MTAPVLEVPPRRPVGTGLAARAADSLLHPARLVERGAASGAARVPLVRGTASSGRVSSAARPTRAAPRSAHGHGRDGAPPLADSTNSVLVPRLAVEAPGASCRLIQNIAPMSLSLSHSRGRPIQGMGLLHECDKDSGTREMF